MHRVLLNQVKPDLDMILTMITTLDAVLFKSLFAKTKGMLEHFTTNRFVTIHASYLNGFCSLPKSYEFL